MMYGSHAIGANNPPPINLSDLLDPAVLQDQLGLDHARLVSRRDALLAGVARFHTSHGAGIASEEDAAAATDFVRQIKASAKEAETQHAAIKRPVLNAGKAIDGFFKAGISERLTAAARGIEDVLTAYSTEKMMTARREAERVRAAAEEEAKRVAAAAERTLHPELLDQAIAAEAAAERARKVEGASTATMSRTRGDLGGVVSLRSRWTFRVTDPVLIPREYLMVDETKLNAAIRGGMRELPGVEVYDDVRSVVR